MGGRMPLSSNLSEVLRDEYDSFYASPEDQQIEMKALLPLFLLQQEKSFVPRKNEFLVEYFNDKEGYHLIMYPYEGRYVHEGLGVLIAKRIGDIKPISFTIAMNDYGVELLSDQPIDIDKIMTPDLFHTKDLELNIQGSINAAEMSRRQFRDISRISGLIFTGFPGAAKKDRHLQSSSQLLFDVFEKYEPDNLLYQQTFDEVMTFQLEEARMRSALDRIRKSTFIVSKPNGATPFSFPIVVDRLRAKMSTEKLEDRIAKMKMVLDE
jgi:ATP-dependent Lhr-like helicase